MIEPFGLVQLDGLVVVITGLGVGLTVILFVAELDPHSFVTVTLILFVPGLLNTTVPGFWDVEELGVALSNTQL